MDIVSYRGPHAPGGVSNALQSVFHDPRLDMDSWWFFARNRLKRLSTNVEASRTISAFSADLVDKHYAYCNQYLWPMFHGCFERAEYDAGLRLGYRRLNRLLAQTIMQARMVDEFFVQDYQLSMLPKLLNREGLDAISFFWHLPWPADVPDDCVERLAEVAGGMAAAGNIGFQTTNYADNFWDFCERHLGETALEKKITVAPVAIDHELWEMLSEDEVLGRKVMNGLGIREDERIVLSVERADYTKGVVERLEAVDHFLSSNAGHQERVRFIEVLPRTRSGMSAYDEYWHRCATKVATINEAWGTAEWQPILWVEEPMSSAELATLYARANVMLITSLADGLNLTAKEYVACHQRKTGALVLSRECGVVSELGDAAFLIEPTSPSSVANAIDQALLTPNGELRERMRALGGLVVKNNSKLWLHRMQLPARETALAN